MYCMTTFKMYSAQFYLIPHNKYCKPRIFFRLGGCNLAFKFWGKLVAKCLKGNRIYKFHSGGKKLDFKEIFLGEVAFIRLHLYNKKTHENCYSELFVLYSFNGLFVYHL